MDPNAALKRIREIVKQQLSSDPEDSQSTLEDLNDLGRLAELVDDLDQWLSKAGFLPDAWQVKEY